MLIINCLLNGTLPSEEDILHYKPFISPDPAIPRGSGLRCHCDLDPLKTYVEYDWQATEILQLKHAEIPAEPFDIGQLLSLYPADPAQSSIRHWSGFSLPTRARISSLTSALNESAMTLRLLGSMSCGTDFPQGKSHQITSHMALRLEFHIHFMNETDIMTRSTAVNK